MTRDTKKPWEIQQKIKIKNSTTKQRNRTQMFGSAALTLSLWEVLYVVSGGMRNPKGDGGTEFPPTWDTRPLQPTELCLMSAGGRKICGKKLHWLILLLWRSRLWGRNTGPLRLRLSSKMLCSSSANSFSEPTSCTWLCRLKMLFRLLRREENRGPRKLRKDWEREIILQSTTVSVQPW